MIRLEARQRPLVAGGVAILGLTAALLHSLWGSPPPPAALPPPLSSPSRPAAVPASAPVSAESAEGLRLHGVMGAGAVIGDANGGQRFVTTGRDVVPGLTLESVGIDHVILRSNGGQVRLDFAGAAAAGPGQATPFAAAAGEAALRAETMRYRLGLTARQQGGTVTGHAVRAGASLPALERAGIRPGDVIVSVNGSRFDQERMLELAWTLAHSADVAFEVERGGQRIRLRAGAESPQVTN